MSHDATPGRSAVLAVDDMSCAHCVAAIQDALQEAMPGTPFAIDLPTHRVTVEGDPDRAAAAIRDAGYEPVLLTR